MTSSVCSSSQRKEKKKHAGSISSKSKQKRLHKKSGKTSVYAAKVTPTGYGLVSDAVLETVAPSVLIDQSWICCFKCQKWRLLPHGHNPDKIPEKWSCSMLDWLPGMNSCDISEEEMDRTVKAPTGYGLVSDAVLETVAPSLIDQSWICCYKCQKWRLLPHDHNPDKIPEKWSCSMLDWLPGMNSCDISEEEMDRTVKALYEAHVPESQNSLNTLPDHGTATGITLDGLQNVDKTHQGGDIHGVIRRGIKNLKVV